MMRASAMPEWSVCRWMKWNDNAATTTTTAAKSTATEIASAHTELESIKAGKRGAISREMK